MFGGDEAVRVRRARVPHFPVSGLTWFMSWAVATGCCGAARVGWWFQVVSQGLGVFLVA